MCTVPLVNYSSSESDSSNEDSPAKNVSMKTPKLRYTLCTCAYVHMHVVRGGAVGRLLFINSFILLLLLKIRSLSCVT